MPIVVTDGVEDLGLDGPAFDEPRRPDEDKREQGINDEDVHRHLGA